ncbi:amidohydrolase [Parasedimentitalea huanghaiensis]|uniref:Amidohydrolase family protein n=1 Tax=Parasedimentitalea huanghaiensis TaxID=2682100 RepID=A0A6L6WKR4_9RHOB|nr:amidohydrolase [Zongyanglinia huanghaiensis]MVO17579.1 amidohydrolase family protein [Zongyanglinia huanghaiensis]
MTQFFRNTALACSLLSAAGSANAESLQDIASSFGAEKSGVVYTARDIITMNPNQPRAQAVAVLGDKIAAVGSLAEMSTLAKQRGYTIDTRFGDDVLIAGLIEPHVHPILTALTMTQTVIAIEDWETTRGTSPAVRDPETYQARLQQALTAHDPNENFVSWGYHHYFHGPMSRAMLDELAPDFPVIIWHRSAHEVFLNSVAMEKFGINTGLVETLPESAQAQTDLENGHLYESGFFLLLGSLAPAMASTELLIEGLEFSEDYYLRNGITLAAEPGGVVSQPLQQVVNSVYGDDLTPFNHYFIPDGKTFAVNFLEQNGAARMVEETRAVLDWGEGRSRFLPQQVKLFIDGAIYSQLMQMKDGYTDGHHGEWIMPPELYSKAFQAYWDSGYQISIHVNGDGGMDVLLDNLETAQARNPRFGHRTVIVHFGVATPEQVQRAADLGAIVSANPYYVTALAGRYAEFGLGPERANRMVPLKEAADAGMPISFHSDMPMAAASPLLLMWSAVNRITAEGTVAGPELRVDLETALKAVTLDAAYTLQMEDEIGSIEVGKLANLTVLEQNPYEVDLMALKDIPVWGTIFEGRVQQAPNAPDQEAFLTLPTAIDYAEKDITPATDNPDLNQMRCIADGQCPDDGHDHGELRRALSKVVISQLGG